MNNYNILIGNTDIPLDSTLSVDERISFCQELIDHNEHYFKMTLPSDRFCKTCVAYKNQSRLDRMGTYILNSVPLDKEYPWQTCYKERQTKLHECDFTDLEQKMNKFKEF